MLPTNQCRSQQRQHFIDQLRLLVLGEFLDDRQFELQSERRNREDRTLASAADFCCPAIFFLSAAEA